MNKFTILILFFLITSCNTTTKRDQNQTTISFKTSNPSFNEFLALFNNKVLPLEIIPDYDIEFNFDRSVNVMDACRLLFNNDTINVIDYTPDGDSGYFNFYPANKIKISPRIFALTFYRVGIDQTDYVLATYDLNAKLIDMHVIAGNTGAFDRESQSESSINSELEITITTLSWDIRKIDKPKNVFDGERKYSTLKINELGKISVIKEKNVSKIKCKFDTKRNIRVIEN